MAEEKKDLLQYLKEEFERYNTDYKVRAQAFTKWHMQARGVLDAKAAKSKKSRLFINKTKMAIISGVGAVLDILLPGADFYDVVGRTKADQQGSVLIKQMMDWLLKIGNFTDEVVRYVFQAAVYGTTFGKIRLVSQTETVISKESTYDEFNMPTGVATRETQKTVRYPVFEMIDIMDVWTDPEGLSPEVGKSHGIFHRVQRTLNYLKAQKRIYKNIDQVEAQVGKTKTDTKDKRRFNIGLPAIKPRADEIELYEYQGLIPAELAKAEGIEVSEDEYEVEVIATVANMEVLIRAERNEQPGHERMIISDVWELPIDKSMYGIGIPESVRGPQIALNATINTRLDNKAWAIASPLIVNVDKIVDANDLVARVNWVIRTHGTPNDVAQFVQLPNVTQDAWTEAQHFERIIGESSNQSQQAQGDFGSNRTAHGVTVAFAAASRPNRLIARGFESNLMTKGLKKMFNIFMQNLDEDIIIRVTDNPQAPEFIKADPMSLALDIDFLPSGSTALAMRETALDGLLRFIDGMSKVMGQIPPEEGRPNWKWLAEQFYKSLGLKNFDQAWIMPAPGMVMPNVAQGSGPTAQGASNASNAGGIGILELLSGLAGQGNQTPA